MSEKGANNAMKWLRKRKKSDRAEASPALAANQQEEVAQEKTEYIQDKTQAAAWPARAHPISPDQPLLEVRGVERTFQVGSQKLHVLKGIEMEVHPGQLVMLKGRSGSGKTTLLNMLGGLDLPTKGEIRFRGEPFSTWSDDKRTMTRRSEIGFIFQAYALMPLLSAYENVELSLRMANVPRHLWKERVQYCLEMVGLGKRMSHRPFEMSGGEQQRVAIAKSIAHKPLLLLADEPTAELDSQMGAQVMGVFRQIIRSEKIAICMTTHDPTILEVADHVYEMVDGRFIT
ncbi:ABC transporter ATP-binding protein [Paenibacillus dendritiformis]|nr:ABC transporter ATP-binding protein [Paenibacillus dendritiformis]NRF96798.1 ABC transporter ATP-binding protein [Paenibacillus dendritiformis]GIO72422.1 ABC transporter ATP-binding protein [Paenibacillus dendritiformis]